MLSSDALIAMWEAGQDRHEEDRALILLACAHPELDWNTLATMPLGRRDAMLLDLRRSAFADRLDIGVCCPRCTEPLEFAATVAEFLAAAPGEEPPSTVILAWQGLEIVARPVTTRDLSALSSELSHEEARAALIGRCVVAVRTADGNACVLPPEAVPAVGEALERCDPLADIAFELDCPECRHAWIGTFDVLRYLWRELSVVAQRLLDEVIEVARHLGWSEGEILALSPARRAHYLSRARAA